MTENTAWPADAPIGYRLTLPPDWVHIPLLSGTDEALDRVLFSNLKKVSSSVPKEKRMSFRLQLRRAVEEQVRAAQKANGTDLYLPVQTSGVRYGIPLAASVLVTEFVATEEDPGPEVVLARLAAADADGAVAETLELADTLAVRREYTRASSPHSADSLGMRHVDYALALPSDSRRYTVLSFSTAGDGDPSSDFTDALTELFDAIMTTFRWQHLDDENPSDTADESPEHP